MIIEKQTNHVINKFKNLNVSSAQEEALLSKVDISQIHFHNVVSNYQNLFILDLLSIPQQKQNLKRRWQRYCTTEQFIPLLFFF